MAQGAAQRSKTSEQRGCGRRRTRWALFAAGITAAASAVGPLAAGAVPPSSTPSWAQQFGTTESDGAVDVAVARNGTVYSLGFTGGSLSGTSAGFADIWVARHNASGTRRWTKQFGTSSIEYAGAIAVSPRGDVYVVGSTEGSLGGTNVNTAYADGFIAKFDSNGRRKWVRQIGSASGGDEFATAVAVNSRGEIYVAGNTTADLAGANANPGTRDIWVARYDASGNQVWLQQYGTDSEDLANGLAVSASGGVYVAGYTEGSLPDTAANVGTTDFMVVAFDRTGTHQANLQWGTAEADTFTDVAVGTTGELYLSGSTEGTLPGETSAGGRDAVIARIDLAPSPTVTWYHQTGSDLTDEWRNVAVRGTDVFVSGHTRGDVAEASAGGYDLVVSRYDTDGQRKWIDQTGSGQFDFASGLTVTSSGNLYLAATTDGVFGTTKVGAEDAVVLKYSASRNAMWVRQLGDTGNENYFGVAATSNGTNWSVGYVGGPGWGGVDHNVDILVAKHDASGNEQFVARFGTDETDYANAAAAGPSGSVVVVGQTGGDLAGTNGGVSKGDYDAFVSMLDSTGAVVWTRQMGSIYFDTFTSVAVTSRGDIYVAGVAGESVNGLTWSGDSDALIAKFDRYGTLKWVRQFGTSEADYLRAIGVSRSGTVFAAGSTSGTFGTREGGEAPLLVSYTSSGTRRWLREYSAGTGAGEFTSIAVTPAGDVYAAGQTNGQVETGVTMQGVRDLFVMRINRNSTVRWARQYGTESSDVALGLAVTASGTVTMVGKTDGLFGTNETFLGANPAAGSTDLVLMRLDRNGRRTLMRQWGTDAVDQLSAVAVTPNGTAYLAGFTRGSLGGPSAGDDDAVTIRFNA